MSELQFAVAGKLKRFKTRVVGFRAVYSEKRGSNSTESTRTLRNTSAANPVCDDQVLLLPDRYLLLVVARCTPKKSCWMMITSSRQVECTRHLSMVHTKPTLITSGIFRWSHILRWELQYIPIPCHCTNDAQTENFTIFFVELMSIFVKAFPSMLNERARMLQVQSLLQIDLALVFVFNWDATICESAFGNAHQRLPFWLIARCAYCTFFAVVSSSPATFLFLEVGIGSD